MSNYLYFKHDNKPLQNRFNSKTILGEGYAINGLQDWQRLISYLLKLLSDKENQSVNENQDIRTIILNELIEISRNENFDGSEQESLFLDERFTEELILVLLIRRLRKFFRPLAKNRCPRLFISHRQADMNYALRIAELATKHGFAYWLDVLDPDLNKLPAIKNFTNLLPLLTACIIEMALINCTHVLACLTPNSRGTLWIPYEYGRITELPGLSTNACGWLHPDLPAGECPDYMLLGRITETEKEIETWLANELLIVKKTCKPDIRILKEFKNVYKLPEKSGEERARITEEYKDVFQSGLAKNMPISPTAGLRKKQQPKSD
jgi:hypothetical protein